MITEINFAEAAMSTSLGQVATICLGVISDIGEARFPETLIGTVAELICYVDHCSIFRFRSERKVHHIGTASFVSLDEGVRSAERYAGGLHAYDPMHGFVHNCRDTDRIYLYKLTPDLIHHRRYRDSLAELQTIERISVLTRAEEVWYSLNLYRSAASGTFSRSEVNRLVEAAALLASLTRKHSELITLRSRHAKPPQFEERLRDVPALLSAREREVCRLALLGYHSKAIASLLELRYSTVLTYRKRAYAKLGISSQNELFRLCLTEPPPCDD